LNVRT